MKHGIENCELTREVLVAVLENFRIKTYSEINVISNGTANRNYLVKVKSKSEYKNNKNDNKIDGKNGSKRDNKSDNKSETKNAGYSDTVIYVIRERSPKYSSGEQILFEEEYLHHVCSKGIPVPVPLKGMNGECWCLYNEKVFQVYPFIDGSEFDCDNDTYVEEGGRFLGRLHSAVIDFAPKIRRNLPRYDDPAVILCEIKKAAGNDKTTIVMNPEDRDVLNYVLKQSTDLQKNFNDEIYHNLPRLYIHGDYHPANVKYMNGTICGLFDFDWVSFQPRLRDVVDGVIYFASRRIRNIAGNDIFSLATGYHLDFERSLKFLKAYCENVSMPLTRDEIKHIPSFMKARLIHSRVQALPKIPKEMAVKMLTEGMKDVLSWIDENQDSYKLNVPKSINTPKLS